MHSMITISSASWYSVMPQHRAILCRRRFDRRPKLTGISSAPEAYAGNSNLLKTCFKETTTGASSCRWEINFRVVDNPSENRATLASRQGFASWSATKSRTQSRVSADKSSRYPFAEAVKHAPSHSLSYAPVAQWTLERWLTVMSCQIWSD